jgi:hypothetical protein
VLREISALSAHLMYEVEQKRILPFKSGAELAFVLDPEVPWITRGLVAKGAITELGAKVKAGKTTLILEMVRAALDGRPFLELATARTPVVYLTEQPFVSFRQALERADLLGRDDFHSLPFSDTRGTTRYTAGGRLRSVERFCTLERTTIHSQFRSGRMPPDNGCLTRQRAKMRFLRAGLAETN